MKLRIRDLREDNDLTQQQISKILLCDQSLYSKYERGERDIPIALLIKLADYYNTSIDYLVGRTDNPTSFLSDFLFTAGFSVSLFSAG